MIAIDWKNPGDFLARNPIILERGPALVTVGIAILIAIKLADFTWRVFPGPNSQPPPAVVNNQTTQPGANINKRRVSPQLVANLHLFGAVQKNVAPKEIPQEKLPDTPLQLKLHGVVATNVEGASLAVISDNTGRDDYYGVGDPLPQGNAVLVEVHADRVVLERNGRFEVLRMPEQVDVGVQELGKESGKNIRARGAGSRVPSYSTYDNAETRRLLKQYKSALSNNPQSLMSLVRARPVNENGKLKGYRIRPGRDPGLFGKFGLKPGDVVVGVNGTPLNDPFKALEIVRDLKKATSLQVDIIRNGSNQSLNFNIDK